MAMSDFLGNADGVVYGSPSKPWWEDDRATQTSMPGGSTSATGGASAMGNTNTGPVGTPFGNISAKPWWEDTRATQRSMPDGSTSALGSASTMGSVNSTNIGAPFGSSSIKPWWENTGGIGDGGTPPVQNQRGMGQSGGMNTMSNNNMRQIISLLMRLFSGLR